VPPPAEFSMARRLKPARQLDFTVASRKRFGGAAEGSNSGVGDCAYDQFYQIKVCTEHDVVTRCV